MVEWCAGYLCRDECIFWVLMDRLEEKGARRGLNATIGCSGGMGIGKKDNGKEKSTRELVLKRAHVSRMQEGGGISTRFTAVPRRRRASNRSALDTEDGIIGK